MQIGNYTLDEDYWGRPEDYTLDRPYYTCGNDIGASDMAGTMASALAATALVWKSSDSDYYTTCMTAAKSLYDYASNVLGNCGDAVSNQNWIWHALQAVAGRADCVRKASYIASGHNSATLFVSCHFDTRHAR